MNCRDEYGWTPLHFAFANGHVECGQILLDSKAQITKDDNGRTPLDVAAEKKMESILEAFKNL